MKKEDIDAIVQLLRQFIGDIESGKALEEAGWKKAEPGTERLLKELGLYEESSRGIRVCLDSPLPRDLIRIEEGDLFSDMQRAVEVRGLVHKIEGDRLLRTGAEISGFAHMLEASDFPVFSNRLFQEGFSSPDEWLACAVGAVHFLTSVAAKQVWDVESIEETFQPLCLSSLPSFEPKKQCEEESADRVRKVLKWDDVLKIIDRSACKIMGFLWYVDRLIVLGGIRYPESMVLIHEKAWEVLEGKTGKSTQELRNAIIEEVERVENGTLDQGFAIASWHEILRVPW